MLLISSDPQTVLANKNHFVTLETSRQPITAHSLIASLFLATNAVLRRKGRERWGIWWVETMDCGTGVSLQGEVGFDGSPFPLDTSWQAHHHRGLFHLYSEFTQLRKMAEESRGLYCTSCLPKWTAVCRRSETIAGFELGVISTGGRWELEEVYLKKKQKQQQ